MSITKKLARKRANQVTMSLESHDIVANGVVRVVGAFNKMPTSEECVSSFCKSFKDKLSPIKDSFRVYQDYPKVVISGFLKYLDTKPLNVLKNMKEVSSNVYMDEQDNSIWEIRNNRLVKNFDENLSELVATASCSPMNKGAPIEALASVDDFVGINDTHYLAYVNPVTAEVSYGVRVDSNKVYSAETGVSEIAHMLVIDCQNLKGEDKVQSFVDEKVESNNADPQALIDYYSQVYKYDPDYFVKIEDIIKQAAVA